jgi:hypothetical protein
MAKKKDKKGKAAKAAKGLAGVKLPKELRTPLGLVAELAQSPLAREVAAAALVAAASALATRRDERDTPAAKPGGTKAPGFDVAGLVAQGVAAFVSGLGQPAKPAPDAPAVDAEPPRAKPKLVP